MKKIILIAFFFLFSFTLRLWNLNEIGRTWDETYYVERGNKFVDLIRKRDFTNPIWYKDDSSGFPPVSRYLYGTAGIFDIYKYLNGEPVFNYDYQHARLVSVFFSSFAVVLVFLFGWKYLSLFIGFVSGLILGMLPVFLGLSQTATHESLIMFFFTATIYSFINFLINPSKRNTILTGIVFGLALGVKYINFLLIPLIGWIYFIWYFNNKKRREKNNNLKLVFLIFIIAFITFFLIWPMPWFHLKEVISYNIELRYSSYSVPEVFFGKLMLIPKIYFIIYFFITTPLLILFFFILGLISISKNKFINFYSLFFGKQIYLYIKSISYKKIIISLKSFFLFSGGKESWIIYAIIAWFVLPFLQSFYNYKQHGLRHIIEIYAPLSIITAIGFNYLISKISPGRYIKFIAAFVLIAYLFLIIFKISPYYLDYFNSLVGGTSGVYKNRTFQIGWWGQGIKEAASYVEKNASQGSIIGVALSPSHVLPPLSKFKIKEYNINGDYDYIIVNYYNVLREGFDDSWIKKHYYPVYNVNADGAYLVTVYKRK